MKTDDIDARLASILQSVCGLESVAADTPLVSPDSALKSVELLEFIIACEREFLLRLREEDLDMETLRSLGHFGDHIRRKLENTGDPAV